MYTGSALLKPQKSCRTWAHSPLHPVSSCTSASERLPFLRMARAFFKRTPWLLSSCSADGWRLGNRFS